MLSDVVGGRGEEGSKRSGRPIFIFLLKKIGFTLDQTSCRARQYIIDKKSYF